MISLPDSPSHFLVLLTGGGAVWGYCRCGQWRSRTYDVRPRSGWVGARVRGVSVVLAFGRHLTEADREEAQADG